jgi:hypothetical protein
MRIRRKILEIGKVIWILVLFTDFCFFNVNGEEKEEVNKFINTFSILKNSRYNRVEGIFTGFELETIPTYHPDIMFVTRFGFGFESKRVGLGLKVFKKFGEEKKFQLGLYFKQETDSNDYKIIGDTENTIFALLMKRDYRDYFYRKSGGIEGKYRFNEKLNLCMGFEMRKYRPLSKMANWSLFGKGEFRENPEILPGIEYYFSVSLFPDFQESFFMPIEGWYYNVIVEKGNGDFNYYGLGVNIKRYQLIFEKHRLVANLYIHSRPKITAEQFLIDLGGVSTLRGYEFKEFTGNEIFLFNFDYFFGKSILDTIPLSFVPFYDMLDIVLFFDAGKTVISGSNKKIGSNKIKSDVGVGWTLAQGFLRLDIAKRLDRKDDDIVFSLRLMSIF